MQELFWEQLVVASVKVALSPQSTLPVPHFWGPVSSQRLAAGKGATRTPETLLRLPCQVLQGSSTSPESTSACRRGFGRMVQWGEMPSVARRGADQECGDRGPVIEGRRQNSRQSMCLFSCCHG